MKRFTETNKWRDLWFRKLSPAAKLLWIHMTDLCDASGVIELDIEAASFDIGHKVTEAHIAELGCRVAKVADHKFFIAKFIPFQYGTLSKTCPAHNPVFKLIEKHGLKRSEIGYEYPSHRVSNTLAVGYVDGSIVDAEEQPEETVGDEADAIFENALEIYEAYPKKVGRPKAVTSIKAAIKDIGFPELLIRTKRYAATRHGQDSKYTPNPATWFNQQRYNDDPSTWTNGQNGLSSPPQLSLPPNGHAAPTAAQLLKRGGPFTPEEDKIILKESM